jgi:hypothetical protein
VTVAASVLFLASAGADRYAVVEPATIVETLEQE